MPSFSHCVQCGRKIRDAFFCACCGWACCCVACRKEHLERHNAGEQERQKAEPRDDRLPRSRRRKPAGPR